MNPLYTYVLLLSLDANKVGWASVAPPQLSRYTPVLDILQPPVPLRLRSFWGDYQFPSSSPLRLCQILRCQGYTPRLTFSASSANGLQFTHHCGLSTGSIISPDLLCTKRVSLVTFDDACLPADGNLHRVVFGIDEKTGILKGRHDGLPGMEPFHTLWRRQSLSV